MAVRLLITACLLFVLFRGVFAAYRFGHDVFYQQSVEAAPGRDIDVRIPEGQSTEETGYLGFPGAVAVSREKGARG